VKDITIFDENYKKEDVENYRLAIQFSLDGFSFTTLDTISGKFNSFYYESLNDDIDFDDYLSSIENFLEKDILIKNYKSVSIVNEIPHSTLIPVSLFDKDKLKKIYEFNHVLDEYSSINYNRMRYSETYCIFSTPAFVSTLLINKFRKYDIFHQAVPFIDDVLKNIIDDEPKVVVNVSKSFLIF
jgi:hypothetical protein